jgi:tRNA-(ms[2]io[6]A)-hydroxylase
MVAEVADGAKGIVHGAWRSSGSPAARRAVDCAAVLHLASTTDPAWAPRAVASLDEVLLDHAHLEKKAAGAAVTLLFRYPEHAVLQVPLAQLAREELSHFEGVLRHLSRRGVPFGRQKPGRYPGRLHRAIRSDASHHLLDSLLVGAVIEARSCERFGLLADALADVDPELASYYRSLLAVEARHHRDYVELAESLHDRAVVRVRLDEIAQHEASVLAENPPEPRLHG